MAGTGPKFSETQRAEVKAIVAALDRRGYNQPMIQRELAERHGVSITTAQISMYLKQIRAKYDAMTLDNRQSFVAEKLEHLREVRAAAWQAYDRSMEDKVKEQCEHQPIMVLASTGLTRGGQDPGSALESAERIGRIVTREGRLPDNAYLLTILKTLEQERQLLGFETLPPSTTVNVSATAVGQVVNIEQLQRSFRERALLEAKKLGEVAIPEKQVEQAVPLNGQG